MWRGWKRIFQGFWWGLERLGKDAVGGWMVGIKSLLRRLVAERVVCEKKKGVCFELGLLLLAAV